MLPSRVRGIGFSPPLTAPSYPRQEPTLGRSKRARRKRFNIGRPDPSLVVLALISIPCWT